MRKITIELLEKRKLYENWLAQNQDNSFTIIDLSNEKVAKLDLNDARPHLQDLSNFTTITAFEQMINKFITDQNATVGVGGYCEKRPFYRTEAYISDSSPIRNVHIGFDVWMAAGTRIFAWMDSKVHSFADNAGEGNYGPTIILEHEVTPTLTFYTLYGHLSEGSLDHLYKGKVIEKGTVFAEIGSPPSNGNWPAHLHFQVMIDMLEKEGDFPGVASGEALYFWKTVCPNPEVFFITD